MFVQVESVDGGGIYVGYEASETEEEIDHEEFGQGSKSGWGAPSLWLSHRGGSASDSDSKLTAQQVRAGGWRYGWPPRPMEGDNSGGDGDGYDAASELGRGYVTDDIPTDVGDEVGNEDDAATVVDAKVMDSSTTDDQRGGDTVTSSMFEVALGRHPSEGPGRRPMAGRHSSTMTAINSMKVLF